MHCNKLNRDAYIETLILSGVSLMMWPRLGKFVKLSWYTVVEQMNFKLESDECELCTESSLVWNQLIITSSCFQLCDVQIFHCQKVCAIEGLPLYPYNNKEICMALFHNRFLCRICITLHYFKHVAAHKHLDHMYVTMISRLLSGSSRSASVTHFQLWILIWHLFWHENLWRYHI